MTPIWLAHGDERDVFDLPEIDDLGEDEGFEWEAPNDPGEFRQYNF